MIRTALLAAAASLALGFAAPAHAGWQNGLITGNGLNSTNGIGSHNGMPSENGVAPQGAVQHGQPLIRGIILAEGFALPILPR